MERETNMRERTALHHARRGWAVLPLHWIAETGTCSCGNPECSSPGKHPLIAHGVREATTDKKTILRWWGKWPQANLGIATGKVSGIAVVDVDARHGGFESLEKLERAYGRLPKCPAIRTGGGGRHFYFSYPTAGLRTREALLPGIDLLCDGSYAVGISSAHKSGNTYLWVHGATPSKIPLPELPHWLLKLARNRNLSRQQRFSTIPEGKRNSTLASLAGTMRARDMSLQAIEAALREENRARCVSPLPDEEVRRIAHKIGRYPPDQEGAERSPLPFRTAAEFASETPTQIPWRAKPWVADGCITEVTGKIKEAGKTSWVTHMVAAVLEGQPFMGEPTEKGGAVYLSEERQITFKEALRHAGLLGRRDLTVLLAHETLGRPWPEIVQACLEECMHRKARLLVVDTFAQFAGLEHGQENAAGDVLQVLQPLQEAAAKGLAIVLVHHERKGGGRVGDSGRGSTALGGAADVIVSHRRPEGHSRRSVRLVQTLSRFAETQPDLLIDLTDQGYQSLGAPGEAAKEQAATDLLTQIPSEKKNAIAIEHLVRNTARPRAALQRSLDKLEAEGRILKTGKGKRGSPFRYYGP